MPSDQPLVPNIAPIDLDEARRTRPPGFDFVLPGLKSQTVGALVSPGGMGKSMAALQAAVFVAGGPDLLGLQDIAANTIARGKVVVFSAEDDAQVLRHRFHALSAKVSDAEHAALRDNLQLIPIVNRGANLRAPHWQEFVIRRADGCRLVILDTLRRLHRDDENNGAAMADLTGWMEEELCGTCATTVLFLHHTTKASSNNGGDSQQASRGSSVLSDNVRWQANLSGLSDKDCSESGVADEDRRRFVRLTFAKLNYCGPIADRIYHKDEHGLWSHHDPRKQPSAIPSLVRPPALSGTAKFNGRYNA